MSDALAGTAAPAQTVVIRRSAVTIFAITWRNLWRNRRRTWLTSGGVAFAVMLMMAAMSLQSGSYATMIDSGTGLFHGHAQVQVPGYLDNPKIDKTIVGVSRLREELERQPRVAAVAPRLSAFALISREERTVAGQVVGVVPDLEPRVSSIPRSVTDGRFLEAGDEAYIGSALARNLGVAVGDEIVLLATAAQGDLVALALEVVGVFDTGLAELDRAMLEIPLATFRDAFGIGDEAHELVIRLRHASDTDPFVAEVAGLLPPYLTVLHWREMMPELEQSIDLDRITSIFMYAMLALLVLFSVVNTFLMTVFERTHEFGMLIAIGVRRWGIVGMLQLEALWMSLLGAVVGVVLVLPLLYWMIEYGIPMGDAAEMLRRWHMPERLHGGSSLLLMAGVPVSLVLACQLAAFLPFQKVRRVVPVEALRVDG